MRDYRAGKISAKEAASATKCLRDIMRTIKMELDVLREFGGPSDDHEPQKILGYEDLP